MLGIPEHEEDLVAKYTVEFSDDVSVEVDLPPNVPMLASVSLRFRAVPDAEFVHAMEAFDVPVDDVTRPVQWRYGVPLCRDGEKVGSAEVFLCAPAAGPEPASPPIPAVVQAKQRQAQRAVDRERQRHNAAARAWAAEHGRPVAEFDAVTALTAPMPIVRHPGQGA